MTDSAVLQHILASLEQIKASQASLQSSHQALQTQVTASKLDIEANFAALPVSLVPPGPPLPLPETISDEIIKALLAHPNLADEDRLYVQVLHFAHAS